MKIAPYFVIIPLVLALAGSASAAVQCIPHRDNTGKILRSQTQVHHFKRTHPCPANGRTTGPCPGYVVDHIQALCVCGKDRPSNMQWQSVAQAKVKDRTECLTKTGQHQR